MRLRFWLVLLLIAGPAFAEQPARKLISELARKADLIVRGTVESKSVQRDADGRIYTLVKLAVAEAWKGDPKSPLLSIVHSGGTLGERRVTALGQVEYKVGEEIVGFFVRNERGEAVTLGMEQGKFSVSRASAAAELKKLVTEAVR